MARGIFIGFIAVLLLGGIAGVAYEVGLSVGAAATGATGTAAIAAHPYAWHVGFGFFPFFGLLFPILFIFLILGLARAVFGGGHRMGYGGGPRMLEQWHKEAHERGSGKAES